MNTRSFARLTLSMLVVALAAGVSPSESRADLIVARGWDLFQTEPGTMFNGVPFTGVGLGSFDFGAPVGVQNLGDLVDTIVQRKADATVGSPTIPIELVALQLVSTMPVDFGAGLGLHFITLQSVRGGPASAGQMTINGLATEGDPHGTFSSFFDVFFDLRIGALNGPIIFSGQDTINSSNVPWRHQPNLGDLLIPGVNFRLGDGSGNQDFFPIGVFTEQGALARHIVQTANPEPSSIVLAGIGATALCGFRLRRRQNAA